MLKDTILSFLKAKLASVAGGVEEKFLLAYAEHFSKTITEEGAIATTITDGVVEQIKVAYGFYNKEVVIKSQQAQETALKNFREKHGIDENGNKIQKPDTNPNPNPDPSKDLAAQITAAVQAAVEPLQTKLSQLETGNTTKARRITLEAKLNEEKYKTIPQTTKDRILKDFDRMSFAKEEDFNTYLTETETDIEAINQELANAGLGQQGKPAFGQKGADGVSKATQEYINSQKPDNAQFAGKSLSEK